MAETKIEWCDKSWNPISGCSPVSPGCKNCYAERMAKRLRGRCGYPADEPFRVTLHPERLNEPLHWRKPSRIFVCSMGDLFHEDVPDEFKDKVFAVMALAEKHTFLVLTKRPKRMNAYIKKADWSGACDTMYDSYIRRLDNNMFFEGEIVPPLSNVYLGVSVEDQQTADERIPLLLQTPAAKRFVSYEPALGPVDFTAIPGYPLALYREADEIVERGMPSGIKYKRAGCGLVKINRKPDIDWLIMGGESGPGARPMCPDWARSAKDQCQAAGVPFFFKGWGAWMPLGADGHCSSFAQKGSTGRFMISGGRWGNPYPWEGKKTYQIRFLDSKSFCRVGKKAAGALLDGKEWREVP